MPPFAAWGRCLDRATSSRIPSPRSRLRNCSAPASLCCTAGVTTPARCGQRVLTRLPDLAAGRRPGSDPLEPSLVDDYHMLRTGVDHALCTERAQLPTHHFAHRPHRVSQPLVADVRDGTSVRRA